MQLLKALIGGLVGGIAGAGAHLWTELSVGRTLPWVLILAGVGAGLGVRLACGRHGRSLTTGIIAALMSFIGVIAASFGSSAIAFQAASKPVPTSAVSVDDVDPSTDNPELTADTTDLPVEMNPETLAQDTVNRYRQSASWPARDMVISAISALVACVLGAGGRSCSTTPQAGSADRDASESTAHPPHEDA